MTCFSAPETTLKTFISFRKLFIYNYLISFLVFLSDNPFLHCSWLVRLQPATSPSLVCFVEIRQRKIRHQGLFAFTSSEAFAYG